MCKKIVLFFFVSIALPCGSVSYATDIDMHASFDPLSEFLKSIEYGTRLKFEYDSNIFLKQKDTESDFKQIVSQSLRYKKRVNDHFFQWGYSGHYDFYNQESVGILGHAANVSYSYRPYERFSVGVSNSFNWLQDSSITTTIGDRVLALGYTQVTPALQMKYELSDRNTLSLDSFYSILDVRDKNNDDFIDNKQFGVKAQVNHAFTWGDDLIGHVGHDHRQIAFPQISQKSSATERPYIGLTKKFPGLADVMGEIGFSNIEMDDASNNSDDNIDYRLSLESVFSLYTKFRSISQPKIKKRSIFASFLITLLKFD